MLLAVIPFPSNAIMQTNQLGTGQLLEQESMIYLVKVYPNASKPPCVGSRSPEHKTTGWLYTVSIGTFQNFLPRCGYLFTTITTNIMYVISRLKMSTSRVADGRDRKGEFEESLFFPLKFGTVSVRDMHLLSR